MYTYQLLKEITEINQTISHFLLRFYKQTLNPFINKKEDFSYMFLLTEEIESIESLIQEYENKGFMVGLTSMVMTTRGIQALPLLDFSIEKSPEAKEEIIEKITTFNSSGDISYKLDGWIIETNNSYHYLGKYITSQENYRHFLGSSLLFRHKEQDNFVVDDRWTGHQLKQGYGAIRIGNKTGNDYPVVVSEIQ